MSFAEDRMRILAESLKNQVSRTVSYCKKHPGEYGSWSKRFFEPALAILEDSRAAPRDRIRKACGHLQVFGGMGSWTDVCRDAEVCHGLYEAYSAANSALQTP